MEYPQAIRNVWAEAYAKKCSAIWTLVDVRHRALAHPSAAVREAAQAQIPALETERDRAIAAADEAKIALDTAEAAYYRRDA